MALYGEVHYADERSVTDCSVVSSIRWFASVTAAPPNKNEGTPTQNWDQTIPTASRFVLLTDFGNAAVRDNETGLVWEESPDPTPLLWTDALLSCASKPVGNRKGWRLPSMAELASLVDPSVASCRTPIQQYPVILS